MTNPTPDETVTLDWLLEAISDYFEEPDPAGLEDFRTALAPIFAKASAHDAMMKEKSDAAVRES